MDAFEFDEGIRVTFIETLKKFGKLRVERIGNLQGIPQRAIGTNLRT
jgi:hypothetical protein